MNQAETEISSEGRVDRAIGRAEAENKLPGLESALGGSGEECKGMEEDGGSGFDPPVSEVR